MDFTEHCMVSYPDEPQSVYYRKEAVTVHLVGVHYNYEENQLAHLSLLLISDE